MNGYQRLSPGVYRGPQGQLTQSQGMPGQQQQAQMQGIPQGYAQQNFQKMPQPIQPNFQQYMGGMQNPGSFGGFGPMQQEPQYNTMEYRFPQGQGPNMQQMEQAYKDSMQRQAPQMPNGMDKSLGMSGGMGPKTMPMKPSQPKGLSSPPPRHPIHTAQRKAMRRK